jgi:vitamin B12 transporter
MPLNRHQWTAASGLICLAAAPAWASAETASDAANTPPIVVVANRVPTPITHVASSVTVVTVKQIELKQERTLPDILRDLPGLNLVQTGGVGGTTSVFMRGANSNHTKVLIDGIDVSDPSTPTGTFPYTNVLSGAIRQVEVLRGPQSGLYGSDAIGGVINIVTKTGVGPAHGDITLEGGSFGTFNQAAEVEGSHDWFNYVFGVDHIRATDTPVTPLDLLRPGQRPIGDFYDDVDLNAKLGAKINDDLDASVVVRAIHSDLRFTGDGDFPPFFPSPSFPDPVQSESVSDQVFTRGVVHWALFGDGFNQTFGLGYTDYSSDQITPNLPDSVNHGNRVKFDYQGDLKLVPGQTLTFGAEHQLDAIQNSPISAQVTNDAGFVQLESAFGERFFNTISLRYDANGRFGGKLTYRIAPELVVPETGTTIRGSIGTGFKAPTLDQLFVSFPAFDFFANPNLKPEQSFGYDIGFEQLLDHGRVSFGATYFHNDITDLIDSGPLPGSSDPFAEADINIGRATTYGVESFVSWRPIDTLTLRGDYTYTVAQDDILHQELLRRPRNKASFNAIWQATPVLSATLNVLYVGSWMDNNRSFTNLTPLTAPGYATVNVTMNYDLTRRVTLFGRIDNLLNAHYQQPLGFDGPGLGVYGGVKAKF